MTWNSKLFAENATAVVELSYITADQQLAWSASVPNLQGYVNVYFDKAWLLGASGNDTTLGAYIYGANGPCSAHYLFKPHTSKPEGSQYPLISVTLSSAIGIER